MALAPQLHYFACRSRGEPIRLLCALANLEYEEYSVPEMQDNGRRQLPPPAGDPTPRYLDSGAGRLADPLQFPFGTCPKWVDGDLVINQSNAILRHVARQTGFGGRNEAETASVDAWLEHCEDIRKAYNDVIYGLDLPPFDETLTNDDPRAVAAYEAHAPAVASSFRPFERRLQTSTVLVGERLTAADVALADLTDVHLKLWSGVLSEADFPKLMDHNTRVFQQPGIAAYIASGRRWGRLNGNALG